MTSLMYAIWSLKYRNIYWTSKVCAWKWNEFCLKWHLITRINKTLMPYESLRWLCIYELFWAGLFSQVGADNCIEKTTVKTVIQVHLFSFSMINEIRLKILCTWMHFKARKVLSAILCVCEVGKRLNISFVRR